MLRRQLRLDLDISCIPLFLYLSSRNCKIIGKLDLREKEHIMKKRIISLTAIILLLLLAAGCSDSPASSYLLDLPDWLKNGRWIDEDDYSTMRTSSDDIYISGSEMGIGQTLRMANASNVLQKKSNTEYRISFTYYEFINREIRIDTEFTFTASDNGERIILVSLIKEDGITVVDTTDTLSRLH